MCSYVKAVLLCLVCSLQIGFAQDVNQEYWDVITKRSAKIVEETIADSGQHPIITAKLRDQYYLVNAVYELRDQKLKAAGTAEEKEAVASETLVKTGLLTDAFVEDLHTVVTGAEVEGIKNALTYNVYPNTVKAYQDMIPSLKQEEIVMIDSLLHEARSYAIHAESANKKHGWFGKYKGRINNYLSARGYDLKGEGDRWEERRKQEK